MKRYKITISDSGAVNIPQGLVRMRDFEIAQLFEVMTPTVRGKIKTLLKMRHNLDCDRDGGIVSGNRILPEYFGLDVVVAIAMQLDSAKADIFRRYMLDKLCRGNSQAIYIQLHNEHNHKIFN